MSVKFCWGGGRTFSSLKSNNFDFETVNLSFLDGDVPRSPSIGEYISQLIRFAKGFSDINDFNNRNLFFHC